MTTARFIVLAISLAAGLATDAYGKEIVLEAEKIVGSDSQVIDDSAAQGGKAVRNTKSWQPLVNFQVPQEGEHVTLQVRHRGGPLQIKGTVNSKQVEQPWNWSKPSDWTWTSFGKHKLSEFGNPVIIIRGEGQGPVEIDAVKLALDGDSQAANSAAPAPAKNGEKAVIQAIAAEAHPAADSKVVDDPDALGKKAVSNSRPWQPLAAIPTPSGADRYVVVIRHKGGPIQLKAQFPDKQVDRDWVWAKPGKWTWSKVGEYSKSDLGDKIVLMRGDGDGEVLLDAVIITPPGSPLPKADASDPAAAAPAIAATGDSPALPADAYVKSDKEVLPSNEPDANAPATAMSVGIKWDQPIRTVPAEIWGLADYEVHDPKSASDPLFNQFMARVQPAFIRVSRANFPAQWLDPQTKDWDVAKIKACWEGVREGYAGANVMLNIASFPEWMQDEQGCLKVGMEQDYANLCVGLMRIMREEVKRPIAYWEITNERDGHYEKHNRLEDLWKLYNTVAAEMKRFDPQALIGGPAFTWAKPLWVEGFVKNCLKNADFVTYHNYASGDIYDTNEKVFSKLDDFQGHARYLRETLDKYSDGRHVPIYLNEYNIKWVWDPIELRHGNNIGAVFHAGVIRRLLLGGADGASQWQVKGHAYGIIEGDNSLRQTAHLFLWARRYLVGEMVDATVSSPDSLEVLAINRDDECRSVLIGNRLPSAVDLGDVSRLGLGKQVELRQVNANGNFDSTAIGNLILPGYSLTLLTSSR